MAGAEKALPPPADIPATLHDLDVNPGERYDRAAAEPDVAARLRARLQEFARDVGQRRGSEIGRGL